ncbi:MAG: 3-dehydroquinate synthase [Candidatus Bipolaricaulota bacterium]|nr:3-dehydroquinate synthase [Candidatus Bipolaricaulota bacterium]MBS3791626.1 3-dehydroquinate synthase [Candidatus Bipolaricaulota bacterium]
MNLVEVGLEEASYPIIIEASSLSSTGEVIRKRIGRKRGVVITDETVDELYGSDLDDSLRNEGMKIDKLVVEPGEGSKSLDVAGRLYQELAELNLHRDSVVLAFGGGVVGDLAGFVGSTFLRGLPVIQVPTTLLAQVDSSVGGKTAINLARGKNLVGTFHQPEIVLIDPVVLETLSSADVRSGLGEVLKYGLIWDENFFWKTVESLELFEEVGDPEELEASVSRCCEIKAEVVGRDELDKGLRQILNFGHTIGHGIEAGSGYGELKHGEAVIWGMIGELWISLNRGYLTDETFDQILGALTRLSLPALPDDLTNARLLEYIHRDKKVRDGVINCVLIKEPGEDIDLERVGDTELKGAWEFLRSLEVSQG